MADKTVFQQQARMQAQQVGQNQKLMAQNQQLIAMQAQQALQQEMQMAHAANQERLQNELFEYMRRVEALKGKLEADPLRTLILAEYETERAERVGLTTANIQQFELKEKLSAAHDLIASFATESGVSDELKQRASTFHTLAGTVGEHRKRIGVDPGSELIRLEGVRGSNEEKAVTWQGRIIPCAIAAVLFVGALMLFFIISTFVTHGLSVEALKMLVMQFFAAVVVGIWPAVVPFVIKWNAKKAAASAERQHAELTANLNAYNSFMADPNGGVIYQEVLDSNPGLDEQIRELLGSVQQLLAVGTSVSAMWTDGDYYPGSIGEVIGNGYLIHWDDGSKSVVSADKVQEESEDD